MKLSQRYILLLLLFLSFIIVLLNDFLLSEIPEYFKYGNKLGQVLSNLSLAYISSYIFYYVVVVLKEKKDKKNIYAAVYELTKHLIGHAYSVYNEIIQASGANHQDYNKRTITKEQFINLCKIANPNKIPPNRKLGPLPGVDANYGKLLYIGAVSNVKHYMVKIFYYMPFLDSEHVRLMNKLDNSIFFILASILTYPTSNTDFSIYANDLYDYLGYVRELEDYNENQNRDHLV